MAADSYQTDHTAGSGEDGFYSWSNHLRAEDTVQKSPVNLTTSSEGAAGEGSGFSRDSSALLAADADRTLRRVVN